jgi:hypothetical protein
MKTSNLIKSLAFVASTILLGASLNAQVTGTGPLVAPAGNDVTDSVTLGSTMPYRVTGDINIHALENLGVLTASQFTWTVPTGGTLLNSTGNTGTTPLPTDTSVSVNWTALGTQTITTTEVPQPAGGQPAFTCTANTQTLNVAVLARPTAAWNTPGPAGGCNIAGTTVTIPVNLKGTGQFNVYYKIVFTPLSGAPVTVVDQTALPLVVGSFQNGGQSVNLSYSIPAATYGTYTVTITKISDRISVKSGVLSQASDIPGTNYIVYSYPTPQTGPINHIKNL